MIYKEHLIRLKNEKKKSEKKIKLISFLFGFELPFYF
jgi:hypothetical protein